MEIQEKERPAVITESDLRKSQFRAIERMEEEVFAMTCDGMIYYANRTTRDRYAIDENDRSVMIQRINPAFPAAKFSDLMMRIKANGGHLRFNTNHLLPDGTWLPVLVNIYTDEEPCAKGREPLIWAYVHDLSNAQMQQRKIDEMSRLMAAFMEYSPVPIFAKSAGTLRYLYWSKSLETKTGIPAAKAIGRTDAELFPREEDVRAMMEVDQSLCEKSGSVESIRQVMLPSGEERTVKTVKTLIPDIESGSLIAGLSVDITELRSSEQQLIKEKMKIEASNQLRGALAYNLGRDMQALLGDIAAYVQMIVGEGDPAVRRSHYDLVRKCIERLNGETSDVLDITRIESGTGKFEKKPFDAGQLCRDVKGKLESRLPGGVRLVYKDPVSDLKVEGDESRIGQVLSNIIMSAAMNMDRGQIGFTYGYTAGMLTIRIEDDGPGMAREQLGVLFSQHVLREGYLNGNQVRLKMLLCKLLTEAMGGTITVDYVQGRGSAFTVTFACPASGDVKIDLPVATPAIKEVVPAPAPAAPQPASAKKNVLVAEDVDSNYQLLQALIGRSHNLRRAVNGLEAISIFMEESYDPDIVLMDMKMPVMNGLEATRELRKLSAAIPIVALTANAFDDDRAAALGAGCTDFLTKPVSAKVLLEVIRKYTE